jgi:FkbM family methyltransferase
MEQSSVEQTLNDLRRFLVRNHRQLTRSRQRLYALEAEQELRRRGRQPRMPVEFTSQFGEDLLVWDLFDGQMEGFFIEAGAFDGYHYSVTYPLEAVGWTGLLVEPLPAPAQECARRRPASRVVQGALSGRNATGHTDFLVVTDMYGGMLSHVPGAGVLAPGTQAQMQKIQVPLTNLNTLLGDHRGAIDLVVIDVEGAESQVLDGFDLARYRPRLLLIETSQGAELQTYFGRFGYRFGGTVEMNSLFVREDQDAIMDRIKWIQLGSN